MQDGQDFGKEGVKVQMEMFEHTDPASSTYVRMGRVLSTTIRRSQQQEDRASHAIGEHDGAQSCCCHAPLIIAAFVPEKRFELI